MMSQSDKSNFILDISKEVEVHEAQNHLTLMIKSDAVNKHCNVNGKLKTILSI